MLIVASVIDPRYVPVAWEAGADAVELRLDRFEPGLTAETEEILDGNDLPLILTVRSREEGGGYSGSPEGWRDLIDPFLPFADYVDIEQRFATYSPAINRLGKTVISSFHASKMPSLPELAEIESRLRSFGIPKIVVCPASLDDVLAFCEFTHRAEKPVVTSIMGGKFRFARILLPIFGSEMFFAYAGVPAAEGQFQVREARDILARLLPETVER
jgi:3-dehydroquinate dehydratase-1